MSYPKIFYGIAENKTDITDIAIANCVTDNNLFIPSDDYVRSGIFGDPVYGFLKSIFINDDIYTAETEINIQNFVTPQVVTPPVVTPPVVTPPVVTPPVVTPPVVKK